jgi:multiple antibiotic resistance protein
MSAEVSFSLGEAFVCLLVTIGPFNVLVPFAQMTRRHDASSKRRLAYEATIIATVALLAAATLGVTILRNWGISVGALFVTGGVLLFLVALRPVLEQYKPRVPRVETESSESPAPVSALAFSPLAFPTIVTPYGVAALIVLMALRSSSGTTGLQIVGAAALVLVLDLLAMLTADRLLKQPVVAVALGTAASVMGVLQVALGVQAVIVGFDLLGVAGPEHGAAAISRGN